MGSLYAMTGRDPLMDRAVARVARNLFDIESSSHQDTDTLHHLKTSAFRLWSAAGDLEPQVCGTVRPTLRHFVVRCRVAEQTVRGGGDVDLAAVSQSFAAVVRSYRDSRLQHQAAQFGSCGVTGELCEEGA